MIIDDDRSFFAFLWSESDAINDDYTLTEKCIMPNFVAHQNSVLFHDLLL